LSDIGSNSTIESLVDLVRDDLPSVSPGSDGVGSRVKNEPLLVITSVSVSDSKSVLVGTNVLSPVDSSVVLHSCLDLELLAVSKWVSWESDTLGIESPSLVLTIVAVHPATVIVVSVPSAVDIKAFASCVSDVSS